MSSFYFGGFFATITEVMKLLILLKLFIASNPAKRRNSKENEWKPWRLGRKPTTNRKTAGKPMYVCT